MVDDWIYETLAQTYVLDTENQVPPASEPGRSRALWEAHRAADRGLWQEPHPRTMEALRRVYLEVEGELEDRGTNRT